MITCILFLLYCLTSVHFKCMCEARRKVEKLNQRAPAIIWYLWKMNCSQLVLPTCSKWQCRTSLTHTSKERAGTRLVSWWLKTNFIRWRQANWYVRRSLNKGQGNAQTRFGLRGQTGTPESLASISLHYWKYTGHTDAWPWLFLIKISIAVIKHHDPKQPGEERVDFILHFRVIVHCCGKSRQEPGVRNGSRGHGGTLLTGFLWLAQFLLLYTPQLPS